MEVVIEVVMEIVIQVVMEVVMEECGKRRKSVEQRQRI